MLKPDSYVITTKGKLGKVILPGLVNHETKEYKPAAVQLNTKVYEIWPENVTPVEFVDLVVMNEGNLILTAEKAFNLIKTLLRNNISVKIDIEATKQTNILYDHPENTKAPEVSSDFLDSLYKE